MGPEKVFTAIRTVGHFCLPYYKLSSCLHFDVNASFSAKLCIISLTLLPHHKRILHILTTTHTDLSFEYVFGYCPVPKMAI